MPSGDGLYRKRGIWYYRYRDWNGRTRAVSTKTSVFSTARDIRTQQLAALTSSGAEPGGSGRLPFRIAAARWLERARIDLAAETVRVYTNRLARVNGQIGDVPLGSITGDTLARYQVERARKAAPSTVNAETKLISYVMSANKQWQRIRDDHHLLREPETRGRCISAEELQKLLDTAEARRDISVMFLIVPIERECGLRHGELRRLRLGDVDLAGGALRIPRDITKTSAGARIVPLTALARAALEQLLERARRLGSTDPQHFLFPGCEDIVVPGRKRKQRRINPAIAQRSFKDAWTTLRRKAGVDTTLRLHDFRHACATDLAAAGVPSRIAMRIMGWTSTAMLRRYEHLQDEESLREMQRVEAFRRARDAALRKPAERASGSHPPLRRVK